MLPLLLAAAAPLAELAGAEIAKLIAGDDPATAQTGAGTAVPARIEYAMPSFARP